MSLQILFRGCGRRKDLLIKTFPYSKFSHVYLCGESTEKKVPPGGLGAELCS